MAGSIFEDMVAKAQTNPSQAWACLTFKQNKAVDFEFMVEKVWFGLDGRLG